VFFKENKFKILSHLNCYSKKISIPSKLYNFQNLKVQALIKILIAQRLIRVNLILVIFDSKPFMGLQDKLKKENNGSFKKKSLFWNKKILLYFHKTIFYLLNLIIFVYFEKIKSDLLRNYAL
jgi:hypothetical protein